MNARGSRSGRGDENLDNLSWEENMRSERKVYTTPELTVHGTLTELTRQTKNKNWGAGDDVLVVNQSILEDAGS